MKSETLATAAATTAARIDDTTIAAVTEEEATAVADLNATTEVAGLIETIGRTMAGIGIVQNATTTISLSVMNATDAVNQEETAEADRTTEGSKAVDNEVVALRGTTAQAIEKTATGIALSATTTTLLGERNATSAVRQKPAAAGDDLHAVTTDVHSKTAINAVVTEEVATGLVETTDVAVTAGGTTDVVVKFSTTTTGIVHNATTPTSHSVKNATDVVPHEVVARAEGHAEMIDAVVTGLVETTDEVATDEVATGLVETTDVAETEEVVTDLVETTDVAETDEVATGLVAATETHMTEPRDDLLDVNHAVKIHAPLEGNLENSVNHAVKALDTLTTDPLVI